ASAHPDLDALLAALPVGAPGPDAVIVPCLTDAGADVPAALRAAAHTLLAVLRAKAEDDRLSATRVVAVTRSAVSADADETVTDPVGAALWGLLRSAELEGPGCSLLLDVDVPSGRTDGGPAAVLAEALATGEPELAVRAGRFLRPRLVRATAVVPAVDRARPAPFGPEDTVLITGGTGALGSLFARHLITGYGARHLILAGRRGADAEGATDLAEELTALGSDVRLAACDVASAEDLATLLASIPAGQRLAGVVHCAGVTDDGVLGSLTPERFDAVLRPKADAAWNLHRQTRDLDLAMFVLFSSVAGTLGSAGQANYATANALLDGLAAYRQGLGLPAQSLAWGMWLGRGMAGHLTDTDVTRMANSGVLGLSEAQGLALFDAARAAGGPVLVPVKYDAATLRRQGTAMPPLFATLVGARRPGAADG
ncbi:beta-ketoacyl reductase, partial [Streptomyces sp. NPDC002690]